MKSVLLTCFIGLILNISGFSQLRQTRLNDSLFVLVPIDNIRAANTIFIKYEYANEKLLQYDHINRLYELNDIALANQVATYDSLVKVLDKKYLLKEEEMKVQNYRLQKQVNTVNKYKLGMAATVSIAILYAILHK